MTTIVKTSPYSLAPVNIKEAIDFAKIIASSDMVPKDYKGKWGNVLVAVQMGAEVGLSPMQSLQNIAVINGRPCLWGDALLALVHSHPNCEDVIEVFDNNLMLATCTVKRKGRNPVIRSFSKDDAVRAKLWNKDGPWATYPKRMLQMRARSWACRDAFADALKGLYSAEEARDIPTEESVPTQAVTPPEPEPTETVVTDIITENTEVPQLPPEREEIPEGPNDYVDNVYQDSNDPAMIVLDFGKHKGACLGEVGKGYLKYIIEKTRNAELKDAASAVLERMNDAQRDNIQQSIGDDNIPY